MALTLLSLRKKTKLLGGIPYLVRQSKLSQAKPVQVRSGQVGASLGKSHHLTPPQIKVRLAYGVKRACYLVSCVPQLDRYCKASGVFT